MSEEFDPARLNQLRARAALLDYLQDRSYRFITPTPATHARVVARKRDATNLRDVFGWSLPFERSLFDAELLGLLEASNFLEDRAPLLSSRARVSSLGDDLFLHSAYPTLAPDSVFFGPDSYRFAAFIARELPRFGPINRLVDIGAGAGVGAVAAIRATEVAHLTLTDVNESALNLAKANLLRAPGIAMVAEFAHTNGLDGVAGAIDAIIANPPYIADAAHRAYRDGGSMHGGAVSIDWACAAAERLTSGSVFLLYTGSAIVNGEDRLRAALLDVLGGFDVSYSEIDPDVFGEELEREDYAEVERIAVVALVAVKR